MVSGIMALVTAASIAAGPVPQGPAATRYRLDVSVDQHVDLTAAGMGDQVSALRARLFVALDVRDTTGGRMIRVTIDSVAVDSASGQSFGAFTQAVADGSKGLWVGAMIVDGKIEGATTPSDSTNPFVSLVSQGVRAFFPGVSAKHKGMTTWADTVSNSTVNEMVNVNSTNITNWSVGKTDGNLVTVTGTGEGTVTGEQGGNPVNGTTRSTMTVVTPFDGPSRSAELESVQDVTILAQQLPEPVKVTATSKLKLSALP